MTQITLTTEQAQMIGTSSDLVLVRFPDGSSAGYLDRGLRIETPAECPFTADEIAAASKEADEPGPEYTTAEVMAYLRSLSPQ